MTTARDTYPHLARYATPGSIGGRPHQTEVGKEFARALAEIDRLRRDIAEAHQLLDYQAAAFDADSERAAFVIAAAESLALMVLHSVGSDVGKELYDAAIVFRSTLQEAL